MQNFKLLNLVLACLFLFVLNASAQVQSKGLNNTFYPSQRIDDAALSKSNTYATGLNQTFFIPTDFYTVSNSFLQPPELNFETDGILWANYEINENFTTDAVNVEGKYRTDYINNLVIDKSIYNVYQTGLRAGSYISKRNLDTGQLEWDFSTNLNSNDKVELDFSLHEREDGNIEVYGFRLLSTFIPNIFPTGVVNRKVFDKDTGDLIAQYFTEFDDGGSFCPNGNGQFGSTFPIIEDEKYLSNCSWAGGDRLSVSFNSDGNGLLIDTTDIISNTLDIELSPKTRYTGAKRLPSGNIAVPISIFNEFFTLDEIVTEVLILDPTGVLVRRIDVSEIMNFTTFMNLEVVGDKIILSGSSFQELVDQQFITAGNIAVIDEAGQVFTQINGIEDYVGIRASLLENGQLVGLARNPSDNCLNILLENDGRMESVQTLCHPDRKWYIATRDFIENEGKLVIAGTLVRDTLLIDQNTGLAFGRGIGAFSLNLAFDLNELELLSSQTEVPTINNHFVVSPNPTADLINLDFKSPESGNIVLVNQLGEIIRKITVENIKHHRWQTNQLSSGIYYIRFENEKLVATQKIVIAR